MRCELERFYSKQKHLWYDGFEMTLVIWNPHINKVQIPLQISSIEKENCSYPIQVI